MLGEVDAFRFGFLVDTETNGLVDDKEDDRRRDAAPDNSGGDAEYLLANLADIAFQGAGGAAQPMHREHVEGIVVTQLRL